VNTFGLFLTVVFCLHPAIEGQHAKYGILQTRELSDQFKVIYDDIATICEQNRLRMEAHEFMNNMIKNASATSDADVLVDATKISAGVSFALTNGEESMPTDHEQVCRAGLVLQY
jgi:hypothetical protein